MEKNRQSEKKIPIHTVSYISDSKLHKIFFVQFKWYKHIGITTESQICHCLDIELIWRERMRCDLQRYISRNAEWQFISAASERKKTSHRRNDLSVFALCSLSRLRWFMCTRWYNSMLAAYIKKKALFLYEVTTNI